MQGVEVSAVFTYEDDPAENCWFGSVAELARSRGIPAFTPKNVNEPEWVQKIERLKPEVIFSFYYRDLIRRPIRVIPTHGCVNLHGSLLPKYRGRSPVNWQLVNGETESGVTLHYIIGRADAGDIIGQERVEVGPEDTAIVLYRKLLAAAERVLRRHLRGVLDGDRAANQAGRIAGHRLRRPQARGRAPGLAAPGMGIAQPRPRRRAALAGRVHLRRGRQGDDPAHAAVRKGPPRRRAEARRGASRPKTAFSSARAASSFRSWLTSRRPSARCGPEKYWAGERRR